MKIVRARVRARANVGAQPRGRVTKRAIERERVREHICGLVSMKRYLSHTDGAVGARQSTLGNTALQREIERERTVG